MKVWEVKQMLDQLHDDDEIQVGEGGAYGSTDYTNFFVLSTPGLDEDNFYYFAATSYEHVDRQRQRGWKTD